MELSEKINKIRIHLKLSNRNVFAKALGIPYAQLYRYEQGKQKPGRKFIQRIKKLFPEFNEAYLFDELDEEPIFDHKHWTENKEESDRRLKKFTEFKANDKVKTVPLYSRVAAGSPVDLWNDPVEYLEITHPYLDKIRKDLYGFICKGDSMWPRFRDGDYVITKLLDLPDEKPRDKDFIVTVFKNDTGNNEANLKLFQWIDKVKGDFILKSVNSYSDVSTHSLKEVRYLFRVYVVISKVDYAKEK